MQIYKQKVFLKMQLRPSELLYCLLNEAAKISSIKFFLCFHRREKGRTWSKIASVASFKCCKITLSLLPPEFFFFFKAPEDHVMVWVGGNLKGHLVSWAKSKAIFSYVTLAAWPGICPGKGHLPLTPLDSHSLSSSSEKNLKFFLISRKQLYSISKL